MFRLPIMRLTFAAIIVIKCYNGVSASGVTEGLIILGLLNLASDAYEIAVKRIKELHVD